MYFTREGIPFIVIALTLAVAAFALALVRRSWSLWLLAFVLTLCTLWVAYSHRTSTPTGARVVEHRLLIEPTLIAELPR